MVTHAEDVLTIVGESPAQDGTGDIIFTSLHDNGEKAVRGHFERLFPVAEVDECRQLYAFERRVHEELALGASERMRMSQEEATSREQSRREHNPESSVLEADLAQREEEQALADFIFAQFDRMRDEGASVDGAYADQTQEAPVQEARRQDGERAAAGQGDQDHESSHNSSTSSSHEDDQSVYMLSGDDIDETTMYVGLEQDKAWTTIEDQ